MEGRLRIACVGDSITYGDGTQPLDSALGQGGARASRKRSARGSWPADLQRLLGSRALVGMFAVPGIHMMRSEHLDATRANCMDDGGRAAAAEMQVGRGCGFGDTRAFDDVLAFQPHVLLLMLGTNDAKMPWPNVEASFKGDAMRLMEALSRAMRPFEGAYQPAPHLRQFLLLPPRVYPEAKVPLQWGFNATLLHVVIRSALQSAAVSERWTTIDMEGPLDSDVEQYFGPASAPSGAARRGRGRGRGKGAKPKRAAPAQWAGDGVHPTAAGCRRMAREALPLVEPLRDQFYAVSDVTPFQQRLEDKLQEEMAKYGV